MTATASSGAASPDSTTPAPVPRPKLTASSSGADSDSAPAAATRRGASRQSPSDPLSDGATAVLIRRTLCPQQLSDKARGSAQPAIEDLLPPLTSRNDVDLQLYAFLAIILREFVQSWYGRITTDETFVAEIVHTVAHCTRALEQRFRKVDLESLVLDEIPDLLDKHITDDEASITEQKENETAYRQLLVQAVLAVLLPTEDLENPCLTSLVGQILSELIIGNVIDNKASQPWLLWEGICILARVLEEKKAKVAERLVGRSQSALVSKSSRRWTVHGFFLSIINLCLLFITTVRFIASTVAMSSSLPPRTSSIDTKATESSQLEKTHHVGASDDLEEPIIVPLLDYSIWSCAGNLIELPSRMPWLNGFLSLVQYGATSGPGRVGRLNGVVDRFLSHHIRSLFSPSRVPPLLRSLRGVLFPNNAPGKPTLVPPSSDAELLALRRRAASALWGLLPKTVGRLYLGGHLLLRGGAASCDQSADDEEMLDEVEGLLMVFSDEYCNKHLLYGVLELVLVRVMPELSEKGVEELWDDRLG